MHNALKTVIGTLTDMSNELITLTDMASHELNTLKDMTRNRLQLARQET